VGLLKIVVPLLLCFFATLGLGSLVLVTAFLLDCENHVLAHVIPICGSGSGTEILGSKLLYSALSTSVLATVQLVVTVMSFSSLAVYPAIGYLTIAISLDIVNEVAYELYYKEIQLK
jgi:hypothetical protein